MQSCIPAARRAICDPMISVSRRLSWALFRHAIISKMSDLRPPQFEGTDYYAPRGQADGDLDGPFHVPQPAQPSHIVKNHDGADQLHLPSALHPWNVPTKPSKEPSQKNKVEKYYYEAWMSGFGRWLCSLVVIGLSAWVIYEVDETPILEATAANLACVRSKSPASRV